jgi:hypothetical protein
MDAIQEKLGHEAECDPSQNHQNPCISASNRPKLLIKGERSLDCSKTTVRAAGGAFALHESYTPGFGHGPARGVDHPSPPSHPWMPADTSGASPKTSW